MTEKTLIISILVALILLWFAETLNMKKTSKVLGGAIDLAFAMHLHICRCILIFYFLLIMAKSFAFNILSLFKSSKAEIVLSFLFLFISSKSHSDFTKHRLSVSSLS